MLLVIDCGNTNIVFGLYSGKDLKFVWRLETHPTPTLSDMGSALPVSKQTIDNVIIASVVPTSIQPLTQFSKQLGHEPIIVDGANTDFGVTVDVPNPSQVGPDRVINAAACAALGFVPAIVVDFGTATTFDVVLDGADGPRYAGGVIAPGVNLSVAALSAAAARLPDVDVQDLLTDSWQEDAVPVLGTTTNSAMQAGILWGYVGLVEGILTRLADALHLSPKIIATGGLASIYAPHILGVSEVRDNLTLDGLAGIFARNKNSLDYG